MSKKNIILLIVLIILAGLAWAYQGPFQDYREKLNKPKNFLSKVDMEKIDKVVIAKITASTTLEKVADRWKVAGTKDFYVNPQTAEDMGSKLKSLKDADLELVSANKEKKTELKTEPNLGTKVELYSGGELQADFVIGKFAGTDYNSSYISRIGDDNTYKVPLFLQSPFEAADWRDNTIFAADKSTAKKLRFQYPAREFTIEKSDDKWVGTIPYKFEVSQDKIDKILDVMTNISSASIPPQKFEGTDLDKHPIIVELSGEGLSNVLMVGKNNGENRYFAKKGDSDNIYLISKEQRDLLDQTIEKLK